MNMKKTFLILAGLASASAMAQQQFGPPPSATVFNLEPTVQNGVRYLCGGVGDNAAAQIKQMASEYDLMVSFATNETGAYLADVDVGLADARGRSISLTDCSGPIMLVDFPRDGKYRVIAEAGGVRKSRTVTVNNEGSTKRIVMTWPSQTVNMGIRPNEPVSPTINERRSFGGSDFGATGRGTR
jgi:hypothetical protein